MAADKVDFGPRIGADPELFVIQQQERDKGSNNKNVIVPACGRFGGTKDQPIVVPAEKMANYVDLPKKYSKGEFAYQEDNAAFEFNVPAVGNAELFFYAIRGMIQFSEAEVLGPKGMRFAYHLNTHDFNPKTLTHPLAHVIGCSPDFNAYLPRFKQERKPFGIEQLGNTRHAGGHVHVQYNHNNVPREYFVKFMDLLVGLPFLGLDKQGERRKFYGLAGIYRPKEYGIEYRTLSNFWVNPELQGKKFAQLLASNALGLAQTANDDPDPLIELYKRVPWNDVQEAIAKEKIELAIEILRHVHKHIPFIYYHHIASSGRLNHGLPSF